MLRYDELMSMPTHYVHAAMVSLLERTINDVLKEIM